MDNGLLVAVVVVVGFLLFREFWTWYWKQSQQLDVLKDIRESLKRLEAAALTTRPADGVTRSTREPQAVP